MSMFETAGMKTYIEVLLKNRMTRKKHEEKKGVQRSKRNKAVESGLEISSCSNPVWSKPM